MARPVKTILAIFAFVAVILISGGIMLNKAAAQSQVFLHLPTGPVTANSVFLAPTIGDRFMTTTFSSIGPGFDVQDNIPYLGWCIDPSSGPAAGTNPTLYSSYDSNLPSGVKYYQGNLIPWDQVNWILNNKQGYLNDVIDPAIKYLITGQRDFGTWDCPIGSVCDQFAQQAIANGTGFVPAPGQIIGVILYSNGISSSGNDGIQDSMIEVTVPTPTMDYGDLPSRYANTLLADDGARHVVGNLFLGAGVSTEFDGQEDPSANKDTFDDGIVLDPNSIWQPTNTVSLTATVTGGSGYLVGWFDWNNDGDFGDSNEMPIAQGVSAGGTVISLIVPNTYTKGQNIFTRFRLYPTNPGTPSTTGQVTNGEVEDHLFTFTPDAIRLSSFSAKATPAIPHNPISLVVVGFVTLAGAGWIIRKRF